MEPESFGPFDALFHDRTSTKVAGYLILLGMGPDAPAAMTLLRQAVQAAAERLADWIVPMLEHRNWRVQLVGATALAIVPAPFGIDPLNAALDRHSWVSPQLAVVASLVDPDFLERSKARLEQRCLATWPSLETPKPKPDMKLYGALLALCGDLKSPLAIRSRSIVHAECRRRRQHRVTMEKRIPTRDG